MPLIREVIVITEDPQGRAHIAPLGLIEQRDGVVIAPFSPSRTLDNLRAGHCVTANVTDDVRVFAGCLTGRRDWPLALANKIGGWRLADAIAHRELIVTEVEEDNIRPRFLCQVVHEASHRPAPGFNRAQAAVIEAAIVVSRLHMIREQLVREEMVRLDTLVSKTAGPRETEAWGWLKDKIDAFYAAPASLEPAPPIGEPPCPE
jgi:uncharacterized protein